MYLVSVIKIPKTNVPYIMYQDIFFIFRVPCPTLIVIISFGLLRVCFFWLQFFFFRLVIMVYKETPVVRNHARASPISVENCRFASLFVIGYLLYLFVIIITGNYREYSDNNNNNSPIQLLGKYHKQNYEIYNAAETLQDVPGDLLHCTRIISLR